MESLLASTNSLSHLRKLKNAKLPISFKNSQSLKNQPSVVVDVMFALLSKLLFDTSRNVAIKSNEGNTTFTTKNETQFFMARTISLIYVKASILDKFLKYLENPIWKLEEKMLMKKLSSLYGLWCLEEHASSLLRYFHCYFFLTKLQYYWESFFLN